MFGRVRLNASECTDATATLGAARPGVGREMTNGRLGTSVSIATGTGLIADALASREMVSLEDVMRKERRETKSEKLGRGLFAPGRGKPGTLGTTGDVQCSYE